MKSFHLHWTKINYPHIALQKTFSVASAAVNHMGTSVTCILTVRHTSPRTPSLSTPSQRTASLRTTTLPQYCSPHDSSYHRTGGGHHITKLHGITPVFRIALDRMVYHVPQDGVPRTTGWCITYHRMVYLVPQDGVPHPTGWCTTYHRMVSHVPQDGVPRTTR